MPDQGKTGVVARLRHGLDLLLQAVSFTLLLSLASLVVAAVGFRSAGSSITWYDEFASVLLAWLTFFGAALAVLRHGHLGFPGFVFSLPPAWRLGLFLLSKAVVVGFWGVVFFAGIRALDLMVGDTLVTIPWMPIQLVQSVLPIAATLVILAELLDLPANLERLRGGLDDETLEIREAIAESLERADDVRAGLHGGRR